MVPVINPLVQKHIDQHLRFLEFMRSLGLQLNHNVHAVFEKGLVDLYVEKSGSVDVSNFVKLLSIPADELIFEGIIEAEESHFRLYRGSRFVLSYCVPSTGHEKFQELAKVEATRRLENIQVI